MKIKYSTRQQRSKSVKDRFWEKVDKRSEDECWNWTAYLEDGYGRFWFDERMERTHRISWIMFFGNIPDGQQVLHTCDNRACVNPKHLFLGINHDNVIDRNKKGRQARGERNRHKLTEKDVWKIRDLFFNETYTQTSIGKLFGVTSQQISSIVNGDSWAWLK